MTAYTVTSGKVRVDGEYYHPGDEFEADLTDEQVAAMEVSPVDEGGAASYDAAEGGAAPEGGDADDAENGADADEEPADEGIPDPLTAEFVESAEYAQLRTAAGEFDGVNGNWGEDRLRTELLDRVEG